MFDKLFNKAPKTPENPKTREAVRLLERLQSEDPSLDIHEAERALKELVKSGAIEELPEPDHSSLDF